MRLFILLLIIIPGITQAQLKGLVVGITDGDTFTLLDSSKNQIKIRMHGIDCPEKSQPFSNTSKKFIAELIYLKHVTILTSGTDRYGRTLGIVKLGNQVINEKMLAAGMAWHYKQYDSRKEWAKLEENARLQRKGLWADENSVPPWEWRKEKKKSKKPN